ncbi:MAG: hypothetical protein ACI8P0_005998 [Planctomycetaceae bacterium]|jgi:hypothetical protein
MGAEELQTLHSFAPIPLPEFRRTQKRNSDTYCSSNFSLRTSCRGNLAVTESV